MNNSSPAAENKNLCILILAAGMGTRMKSELPKVLHEAAGKPLLGHVIKTADSLRPAAIGVVVGHKAETVREKLAASMPKWAIKAPVQVIEQKELTGSGSAVKAAAGFFKDFREVVILCGDAPLVSPSTLAALLDEYREKGSQAVILTARVPDPKGYGRIVKNGSGEVDRIVEQSEADETINAIDEINSGMYVFSSAALAGVLGEIKPNGPKKEYYLTDSIELIKKKGGRVTACAAPDYRDILGINSRAQLAEAASILRARKARELMDSGVTIVDPDITYIDSEVSIGRDSVVMPGAFILGATSIGDGCLIGPYCEISDCRIGSGVTVKLSSCLHESEVADNCAIGPFAHLRPGSRLMENAKVGNFSELKKAVIGKGSKVNHLSYVGDCEMGEGVNVGAGTITCNYDGVKKHKTVLGDRVFVGSNVNLVAPVTVGSGAKLGAGSTITEDVPEHALAIARARQIVKAPKHQQ